MAKKTSATFTYNKHGWKVEYTAYKPTPRLIARQRPDGYWEIVKQSWWRTRNKVLYVARSKRAALVVLRDLGGVVVYKSNPAKGLEQTVYP